jgi:hypothetical protein
MSTTIKVAAFTLGIVLLLAFLFGAPLMHMMFGDDDERPPIIVRNGSLIFESDKDWMTDPSGTHRFKPDHAKGKSVVDYSVVVTGSSTAACTGATLTGTDVFVDYLASASAPSKQFHFFRKLHMGKMKHEPVLDSPDALTVVPQAGTAPAQLVYPAGPEGWISNVTVGTASCAFSQPADATARKAVRVEIKPTS